MPKGRLAKRRFAKPELLGKRNGPEVDGRSWLEGARTWLVKAKGLGCHRK